MTDPKDPTLGHRLAARFDDAPDDADTIPYSDTLHMMAARGSCRSFRTTPVPIEWQDTLAAIALASPTKSDLQQRDIILLRTPEARQSLAALVGGQSWVADAPMIAVFCGNNRRQRLLHAWRDVPFANDHIDAVFNATADAAIALGAFVTAAEALGLGCCPISAVRNEAAAVSKLLNLPKHVFPFAGLAFGFPAAQPQISKRLPLGVTCHVDRYTEAELQSSVQDYDQARAKAQPYEKQRFIEIFGDAEPYTWSDDKVRQYSQPERQNFGAYLRAQGFKLD